MQVDIIASPAFSFGRITLPAGSGIRAQSGAMGLMQGDVTVDTSTQGGFLAGIKRSFGGASFFLNEFKSGSGGVVGVGASLPGDLSVVSLTGSGTLLVQSGCWIASDLSVDVDSSWGGAKGFFSGAGLILLRCSGQGDVLVSTYGAIENLVLSPGEKITFDTGNVVAFDDTVQYAVRKAGGNWKTTLLGGEGFVTEFTGPGRVWWQTRSTSSLIQWIQRYVPPPPSSSSS
jgi:uncharacterized protein (TIGR00266 family)